MIVSNIYTTIGYFLHERIWDRIKWGKIKNYMGHLVHKFYSSVFRLWRRKRFEILRRELKPTVTDSLVDVGGNWWNWQEEHGNFGRVLCVNSTALREHEPAGLANVELAQGDGCKLFFADAAFDIAFSNSVIEHVGDFGRQQEFAREIRRVGKRLWVQTPAFECPLEPHFLALAVHWLPGRLEHWVKKYLTPRAWLEGPNSAAMLELLSTTRLLSRREFSSLFPDCRIITERYLGLIPKAYIAVR